jgi:hypothetical protein
MSFSFYREFFLKGKKQGIFRVGAIGPQDSAGKENPIALSLKEKGGSHV